MINHKYRKPAVQEAIFEAKFANNNRDAALPGQIFEKIKKHYPKKKDITALTIFLGNNTAQNNYVPPVPVMQAWKEDDSALVQIGHGIVIANQLKYSTWEKFLPSVHEILNAYITCAEPHDMDRLGVRYINSFIFPEENINISDYFDFGVRFPSIIDNIKGFDFTFINKSKDKEFEIKTKFRTDTLKISEKGNKFILDIDCYITENLKLDIEKLVVMATKAHDHVKNIFESMITEKTRKIMEGEND